MSESPTTEIPTFVFTDVEGSTARWERTRLFTPAQLRDQLRSGFAALGTGAISVEPQALNFIGELERADGNLEQARELQLQALELSRQIGEMRQVAMVAHNLGLTAHGLGDDDTVDRLLHESLELAATQGFGAQTAHSLDRPG